MDILITGGAGFIGSNLSHFFLSKDHKVTVIDNLLTSSKKNIESSLINKNFKFYQEDLLTFDFNKIGHFDIIYHLASPASPPKFKTYSVEILMVNSLGTKLLLDFCNKSKSKTFVMASTSEVYGDPLVHPQKESYWGNVNPVGPRACYDEAKRFAEALVTSYFNKYNLDVRIARIFNTYGPNMEKDDGRVVSNFIMQSLTNTPLTIYGTGDQTRSFCYVDDMVQGLYLLGTSNDLNGQIINIGNPREMKITELADIIKELTKTNAQIIFNPIDEDDPQKRKPDITKANELLGWQPKLSLEEGLRRTINYFKTRYLS